MSTPTIIRLPSSSNAVWATTSMAGSAIFTPGVSFTVSQTLSGKPDSPAEICSVALPATFSIVVVSELSSVTLAVRKAKKTATPSAMPSSVNKVRSRCRRHCFQVVFASAESIVLLEQFLQKYFEFALAVFVVSDFAITRAPFPINEHIHRNHLRRKTIFEPRINEDREIQLAPRGERPDFVRGVVCRN